MKVDMDKDNGLNYPKRAVVDTNVILNVALGSLDNLPPENLKRSKKLLDDALGGKLELLLPTISLIELSSDHLLRSEEKNPSNSMFKRMKKKVMQWCEDSELPFAELPLGAAEWFNETESAQCIFPLDASIVASAIFSHSSVVYTWDDRLIHLVERANRQSPIGITAMNPPVRPLTLGI
jgi:predicted nucleic acid-binding protein